MTVDKQCLMIYGKRKNMIFSKFFFRNLLSDFKFWRSSEEKFLKKGDTVSIKKITDAPHSKSPVPYLAEPIEIVLSHSIVCNQPIIIDGQPTGRIKRIDKTRADTILVTTQNGSAYRIKKIVSPTLSAAS
ncbi:MAG: hypothetical protein ABIO57_03780 [Candidatus Paceibacterota bacterium]